MKKTVTFTLRIPEEQNERIKKLAEGIGSSQNALILQAMDLFLNGYETIALSYQEEFRRFLSQNSR